MSKGLFDLVIIGGGVNGCGIARDAAGRGLSVLLAEQGDLAEGTSSASTKLIHGGLRYLEHFEFRLVRESLQEREVLLAMAPHIVQPMRFVLPHHKDLRPAWLIRLGLFFYDHLGKRKILPPSHFVNLRSGPLGDPLKPQFARGFEYSDCCVDDARLVVLNAVDAARNGADIRVRTQVHSATRKGNHWEVNLLDRGTGQQETVAARMLINAAGPWISEVISERLALKPRFRTRLVKGSHIIVPSLFDHSKAYIFQNADQRIVFAIPYEKDFTLIGTTDVDFEGDPGSVAISPDEVTYLCGAAGEYFTRPIHSKDVIWSYAGLRPLYDDGEGAAQEATRDYELDLQDVEGEAPLLNIFGGKITTYRCLSEEVLKMLRKYVPHQGEPWTMGSVLPGGDIGGHGMAFFMDELAGAFPAVERPLIERLALAYGTTAHAILSVGGKSGDLGRHFGAGLYEAEVDHLVRNEWATAAEDILWRRSKLGLRMTPEDTDGLTRWLQDKIPADSIASAP